MYQIHKQVLAEEDLLDIWDYSFEQWGVKQADRYLDDLEAGILNLSDNPEIGNNYAYRENYRKLLVNHHIVFYRLSKETIHIVRVLHQSMEPNLHL